MSSLRLCGGHRRAGRTLYLFAGLLVVGGWLAAAVSTARAETLLRWKFTAGEHLMQTFDQNMQIEMTFGDMPIKSNTQQTMIMSWRVNEVDDEGVASTSVTIDRMKMAIKAPGFEVAFDTDDEEPQQQGPLGALSDAVKNLIGMRYDVKMAPTGEILDVSIPAETREALKQQFSAIPGMQQMADMFTDEGIKNMASQSLHAFPEQPVTAGDTWTKEGTQNIAQLGEHTTKTVYEYIGAKDVDGRAIEQIKATMETDFAGAKSPNPGATMDVKEQAMSGVIDFDNELGRMTQSSFDMEMAATITVVGQSIEQQINGKIVASIEPAGEDSAGSASDSEADSDAGDAKDGS